MPSHGPPAGPLRCRVDTRSVAGAPLLKRVLADKGWVVEEDGGEAGGFNVWWRIHRFAAIHTKHCRYPQQRLNHFSHSHVLTKKSLLAQLLARATEVYGSPGPVAPKTFLFPRDAAVLPTDGRTVFICKPVDSSRGRGIFLTRDFAGLQGTGEAVVQEYVTNPLLLRGYKFDLRVYAVVTSFQPLRVYLYDDAIARLCGHPYDGPAALTGEGLADRLRHLTNASVNKKSDAAGDTHGGIGAGCKFLWRDLWPLVEAVGLQPAALWHRITALVLYTCMVAADRVGAERCCFELFGFDILLDDSGQPWLMEVNFSPDLIIEGAADEAVKPRLMAAVIDTLLFPVEAAGPLPPYADRPVPGSGLTLAFPYDAETEQLSLEFAGSDEEREAACRRGVQLLIAGWVAAGGTPSTATTAASPVGGDSPRG
eukprot:EG_transcript_11097